MMHRQQRTVFLLLVTAILFSACKHGIPEHAKYIPKDAVAVAGVNLRSLSKKIAWNVITGSKLFKEMQARIPEKNAKDAIGGIEKSGIDFANTYYLYVKTDNRFKGGNRVTALIPLSDAGQWESFIKMVVPKVEIKQVGDRKEASLSDDMYVGWTKNLLIIINVMPATPDYTELAMGTSGPGPKAPDEKSAPDKASISAEMDIAFKVKSENSIIGNAHFSTLELAGHDVTFWLNYEQLMNQMSSSIAEKMSMSLNNALWKDAAFASGFNFEKGKITGDMHYYISPEMKDLGTEFGSTNADKDMTDRLPSQNLDMIAAMHISPKGLKIMLEKLNLLGLANVGLASQDMDVNYILDAFTGDMAFEINDFSLHSETVKDSFMGQVVTHQNQKPSLSISYVLKINKKDNFQKMVKMAKDLGLQPDGSGFTIPITDKDSVYIMISDQYAIASNKRAYASGFLAGDFKSQKMSEPAASLVTGHPWAFYLDVQQFCKNIDPGVSHSPGDSLMISESKKLLNNISVTGGSFKNNAFEYHLDINFMNTEENSIIELMDYGMKMSDAGKAPL
jgi:hypothetical protein